MVRSHRLCGAGLGQFSSVSEKGQTEEKEKTQETRSCEDANTSQELPRVI